ncbi:hypothetical protein [Massilia sp. TS11]|uniref:hypothetical protein n=1 Tax=Massilia sp. TS11 TaxID=2908003 RepID=UPI001EDA0D03|nr:hypothetical protein [Massilia sp. TS11]MCG2583503.1 hypothetical protein [Massilia sp. TS11]
MGYHLIIRRPDGSIAAHYADTFEGLCQFDGITSDAIIYQAAPEWKPSIVGAHASYNLLAQDWYRAGIRAQWQFFEEAKQANLIPEKISQDPESFEAYTAAANMRIKRGDFLLRRKNIEVEVKCLTLYADNYYLPYAHIKAHENMQALSAVPVWFAIYARNGDCPVPDSLQMVSVNAILSQNNGLVSYDTQSQCLVVPRHMTSAGFSGI